MKCIRPTLCQLFLCILLGGWFASQSLASMQGSLPLRFSVIPKKNVEQQIVELKPLLDHLSIQLKRPVEIVYPQSYQAVMEGMLSHQIDFAILGPASYARTKQRDPDVEAFASFSQRKGHYTVEGNYYRSILFSLKGSGTDSLTSLKGRKVALTDPNSTSGALIPQVEFVGHIDGSMNEYFGSQVFSGSHDRSIQSVIKGFVDAAFVASSRLDEAVRKGILKPENVIVHWRSKPLHYDPFVFRSGLDPEAKRIIRKVFFTPSVARDTVLSNKGHQGIVPVSNADYQNIHDLLKPQP